LNSILNACVELRPDGATPLTPEPTLSPVPPPIGPNLEEQSKKYDAAIGCLQQQLACLHADIRSVDAKTRETFDKLQAKLWQITEHNSSQQVDIDVRSLAKQFDRLQVLVTSRQNSSEYEELRTVVDTLAESSISRQRYAEIETVVRKMMHSHVGSAELAVNVASSEAFLKNVRQQSEEIQTLSERLKKVETKSTELRDFIETLDKSGDNMQRAFKAQQRIVHVMQREVETHRRSSSRR
jgi:hypothetical protein